MSRKVEPRDTFTRSAAPPIKDGWSCALCKRRMPILGTTFRWARVGRYRSRICLACFESRNTTGAA